MSNSTELSLEASNFKNKMLKLKHLGFKQADLKSQIEKYRLDSSSQIGLEIAQTVFLKRLDYKIKTSARDPLRVQILVEFEQEVRDVISCMGIQVATDPTTRKILDEKACELEAVKIEYNALQKEILDIVDDV